jgi:ribosomal protein S18 acetylase RimI-like enzyme
LNNEKRFIYTGNRFPDPGISPVTYQQEFFQLQLDLESDVFYCLRKENDIRPYRINQCNTKELENIKKIFESNRNSFFFLFDNEWLVGSILLLGNYIQSLSVARNYQRKGYGTKLTEYAVNYAFDKGYRSIELNTLPGNIDAEKLYRKLGFLELQSK